MSLREKFLSAHPVKINPIITPGFDGLFMRSMSGKIIDEYRKLTNDKEEFTDELCTTVLILYSVCDGDGVLVFDPESSEDQKALYEGCTRLALEALYEEITTFNKTDQDAVETAKND